MTDEKMAQAGTSERHEQIAGAVARGWCSPENCKKTMDSVLAFAIVEQIETLLKSDIHPKLGCATTRELITELAARAGLDLNYRTIDS